MKKLVVAVLVTLACASCQNNKIGFVDNVELVNEYQKKKDLEEKYKAEIEAFRKRADSASQAFQLEIQAFQLEADKMSPQKLQEAQGILQQKQQMLQNKYQGEEQAIASESQRQNDSIIATVKRFIKEYGKEKNYTYILGANNAGSVMYGSDTNDLTDTVLEALNKEYAANK